MIKPNGGLYDAVKQLARRLETTGDASSAIALRSTLEVSTLPGEIFEELACRLEALKRCPHYQRLDVRMAVDELLEALDHALGGHG